MSESWALKLEYDGTGFAGWQIQSEKLSVQQVLEDATAKISNGLAAPSIVAGRTDAGVHACAQVAQIALAPGWRADRLRAALNHHMKPHRVVILIAARVPDGWNARFSALARHYRYVILNRSARPALNEHRAWHIPSPLDFDLMQQAANELIGRHDFSSFRASACQASGPIRTLDRLDVGRTGDQISIEASARSFLHHQVRNMVGTLRWFGERRREPSEMRDILHAKSRAAAGVTAPAHGLFLTGVTYDPDPFR